MDNVWISLCSGVSSSLSNLWIYEPLSVPSPRRNFNLKTFSPTQELLLPVREILRVEILIVFSAVPEMPDKCNSRVWGLGWHMVSVGILVHDLKAVFQSTVMGASNGGCSWWARKQRGQAETVGGDNFQSAAPVTSNSSITFKGGPPAGGQVLKAWTCGEHFRFKPHQGTRRPFE